MTLRRTALWCGAGSAALLAVAALAVALAVYRPQLVRFLNVLFPFHSERVVR
ncbi:MAG: hypothetical protein OEM42_01215 [Deltaproteobacteria bacterium]|nr:hypothetical protein [Deltaproteobacteria bacterium]